MSSKQKTIILEKNQGSKQTRKIHRNQTFKDCSEYQIRINEQLGISTYVTNELRTVEEIKRE
jgi:hypothetical protein